MTNLTKAITAGVIFVGGYLVGFYEMKYKTMRVLLISSGEKNKEEESQ